MAILRAGPWGELGDEFQDPVSTPTGYFPAPVNCARDDWPNQNWGAVYVTKDNSTEETGIVGLDESVSVSTDSGSITISFCWQATGDFDVDLNWSFTGTQSFFFSGLTWTYQTIEGNNDYFFDTPSNSGTETVTLPATTFGKFSYNIAATSGDSFTITSSIS